MGTMCNVEWLSATLLSLFSLSILSPITYYVIKALSYAQK